jgi:hypothetical protein
MQEIKLPDTIEACYGLIHQFISVTRGFKVTELEARLNQNSGNSSTSFVSDREGSLRTGRPPQSEGFPRRPFILIIDRKSKL